MAGRELPRRWRCAAVPGGECTIVKYEAALTQCAGGAGRAAAVPGPSTKTILASVVQRFPTQSQPTHTARPQASLHTHHAEQRSVVRTVKH